MSGDPLSLGDLEAVAADLREVAITEDNDVLERVHAGEALVSEAVDAGRQIYGITTGFGGMANQTVSREDAEVSQENLLDFLSCGTGEPIAAEHVRAAMVLRANMLLRGASGVRLQIVERLIRFLNANATPQVPEYGSIGASGDLVPLGVLARAITGQSAGCRVDFGKGIVMDRDEALEKLNLPKLTLKPKEGLAIVNGTTFSAAIAANCLTAAKRIFALSFASHAMMIRALLGHDDPFANFVHRCKPHPGQVWAAEQMKNLLNAEPDISEQGKGNHIQDRYSIRCLPQYLGPIVEGLARIEKTVKIEMNSVTDNPVIDVSCGHFYQSGNFLGQYIGMAMDDLRRYLGLMAKHLDVQIALLVTPEFSHGLPASLAPKNTPIDINLKGLQITGNSLMPMLMHLAAPVVDHYPTHAEQFNQNINGLSWGAATQAIRSLDIANRYTAVALIFGVQSIDVRSHVMEKGNFEGRRLLNSGLHDLYDSIYDVVGQSPGKNAPLVSGGDPGSLETRINALADDIANRGKVVRALKSLTDSFNELADSLQ